MHATLVGWQLPSRGVIPQHRDMEGTGSGRGKRRKIELDRAEEYARIPNVRDSNEDLEGILLIGLTDSPLYVPLDLCLALFAVAKAESEDESFT